MASNFIVEVIVDHYLLGIGKSFDTLIPTLRLYTTMPSPAASELGTEVVEGGSGYTRQAVDHANWAGLWSAAGDGNGYTNTATINLGTPAFSWGTVAGIGIAFGSAASADQWRTINQHAFSNPREIVPGDEPVEWVAGAFRITFGGAASPYLEQQLFNMFFVDQAGPHTSPSTLYLALSTTVPAADGSITEVSTVGTGYDRVLCGPGASWWYEPDPLAAESTTYNLQALSFNAPTDDWGTVRGAAIYDAQAGGNQLFAFELVRHRDILFGVGAPVFTIGELKFNIVGGNG